MLLRDELQGGASWTPYITGLVKADSGVECRPGGEEQWQATVRLARNALAAELDKQEAAVCARPNCTKPATLQHGEFCSKKCRLAVAAGSMQDSVEFSVELAGNGGR